MNPEVQKILSMIESGKITAEQGEALLRALGRDAEPSAGQAYSGRREGRPSFVGIYVTEGDTEQVRVKIPLGLLSCFEKFVPREVLAKVKAHDVDLDELFAQLKSSTAGEVLTVDASDGTKVRICCE